MKRFFQQLLLWLLLFASVVGVLWLSYTGDPLIYLLCAASFLFSLAFIPALHEGGHVAMGALSKMQFLSVTFFCFSVTKNGIKFVSPFGETAGETKMYLTNGNQEENKRKFFLFSMGGVLFTFIYLVICLPIVIAINSPLLWATLGMTLPYALYQTVLNLMPWTDDSGAFDGAIFWGLCKNDPSILVLMNIFIFQGELIFGKTPSQIEERLLFDLPQLPEDDAQFAPLQLFRYYYYLDSDQIKEAVRAIVRLEVCSEYIHTSYLPLVYSELLYVYSKLTPNEDYADRYFALLDDGAKKVATMVQATRALNAYKMYKGLPADLEVDLEKEEFNGLRTMEKRLRL